MAAMPNITVELSEEAVQKLVKIREASTSTAESALAAVYAAIEQQAGYQDANLEGLAALVTALSSFPTGTLFAAGEVAYTESYLPGERS